jgi:hypothetical protein
MLNSSGNQACAIWFLEQAMGDEIRPFKIHVNDADLEDLKKRLRATQGWILSGFPVTRAEMTTSPFVTSRGPTQARGESHPCAQLWPTQYFAEGCEDSGVSSAIRKPSESAW